MVEIEAVPDNLQPESRKDTSGASTSSDLAGESTSIIVADSRDGDEEALLLRQDPAHISSEALDHSRGRPRGRLRLETTKAGALPGKHTHYASWDTCSW